MKRSQKEYNCFVCGKVVSTNMLIGGIYTCGECKTSYQKDAAGIFITKEPSQDWGKRNVNAWALWESSKKFAHPYVEIFDFE